MGANRLAGVSGGISDETTIYRGVFVMSNATDACRIGTIAQIPDGATLRKRRLQTDVVALSRTAILV